LVLLPVAFRYEDAARYHAQDHQQHDDTSKDVSPPSSPPESPSHLESPDPIEALSPLPSNTRAIFSHTATYLSALYCLLYVGTETAISGWIVTYMSRSRHASPFLSALSSSFFWGGMVLGRVALGLVSERLGVWIANVGYLLAAITLQLILALGTLPPAVCVALVACVGFLMGPLYPGGVVLLTQLVPRGLHVAVVSFVGSVGQAGGALFPFLIGAMVERVGIEVFQYVLVVLLTGALGVWLVFARLKVET
jgi:fucose permease